MPHEDRGRFSDEDFDRSRSRPRWSPGRASPRPAGGKPSSSATGTDCIPTLRAPVWTRLRQRADMEDRRKALDAAPGASGMVAEKPQNAPLADLRDMEVMRARWNGSSGLSPKGWAGSSLVRE